MLVSADLAVRWLGRERAAAPVQLRWHVMQTVAQHLRPRVDVEVQLVAGQDLGLRWGAVALATADLRPLWSCARKPPALVVQAGARADLVVALGPAQERPPAHPARGWRQRG